MLVKNWMNKDMIYVDIDTSIEGAMKLLNRFKIRILPVINKEKLVGIVTDRDLKRASASDATSLSVHELNYIISKIKVKEIMTKEPVTVPPDYTLDETAKLFLKNKISGVPVVDNEQRCIGIITQTDLFRAIVSFTGFAKKGLQFAFRLEDRPGSIKEVTDIIRLHGGRLSSILSSYDRAPEGYRNVYISVYGINRLIASQLKEALKLKANLLYVVNYVENIREIFEDG
ncbi:MAG: CBS domain-containing protein [Deltaproteobacteria bacterium]|nr:CBS domain-containing protein [Deltaproteobacteria bacterium]